MLRMDNGTDKPRLHGRFDEAKPDKRTPLQEDSQDTAFKTGIWILLPECHCGCAAMSLIETAIASTCVTEKTISLDSLGLFSFIHYIEIKSCLLMQRSYASHRV